jgi:uncharacterized protein YkwD
LFLLVFSYLINKVFIMLPLQKNIKVPVRFTIKLATLSMAILSAAHVYAAPSLSDLLAEHNAYRQEKGASPLCFNGKLNKAAEDFCGYMAVSNDFSHTSKNGSQPQNRTAAAGYEGSFIGENIAEGYPDVAAVMMGWINSPGHEKNIRNPDYQHVGLGVCNNNSGPMYWVAVFAASSKEACAGGEAPALLTAKPTPKTTPGGYAAALGDKINKSLQQSDVGECHGLDVTGQHYSGASFEDIIEQFSEAEQTRNKSNAQWHHKSTYEHMQETPHTNRDGTVSTEPRERDVRLVTGKVQVCSNQEPEKCYIAEGTTARIWCDTEKT